MILSAGAFYLYFDWIYIHSSTLNNILLLQLPLVQLIAALAVSIILRLYAGSRQNAS